MKYGKRIVLFTLFAMNLVDQPAPLVQIEQGILSGKISSDGTFFEYLGIPYATTNSSTRFKAPLPSPPWEGVYKAVDEIYQCPQSLPIVGVVGTENCLKINVYVPAFVKKPLPVMVYIHGGGFVEGSGGKMIYGPDFLVKQDIILVTFNYRLGTLGFLCLGIKEAPGNAAIKDQIVALKWVQKNIRAFGGDPDNVTVFGESAGAASTSLLLASSATKGLFHKAIVQSGASTANWGINRHPLWTASLIVKDLGYDTKDPNKIYEILSKLPYKELVKARPRKHLGMYFDTQMLNHPCVEQNIEGEEPVITDLPFNMFKKNINDIPVIHGTTSNEGVFLAYHDTEKYLAQRNARYIFASDLEFTSEAEAAKVSKMVREHYFGDKNISFEVHNMVIDLNTHLYFEIPSILESQVLISDKANVYNYYFNYNGGRNVLSYLLSFVGFKTDQGAAHSDELFYLFDGRWLPLPIQKKDRQVIEWMTKLWTNFAKHGDPTPGDDLPEKWEPSTKETTKFLYIDNELKMGPIPNPEVYRLWADIYAKYRKKSILNENVEIKTDEQCCDEAPQPPPHWEGIFKATEESYQCPQYTPIGVVGTEDCLKINVFVPAMAQKPLAVMVYIHGGAFLVGNGGKLVYAPDFFMQKDVILVTFNYRLGALGFLCLGLKKAPGNAGLKDQVAALRWVKKNIRAFGGDPDNVTIFGHSAGGTSVGLLVASEITEGLFNRAILQSGSSLANWAINRDPILVASTMAKFLGHHTKDPEELYDLFNNMPYKKIVTAIAHVPLVKQFSQHLLYLPCVEKEYKGVESFITNIPYNLLMKKPKNISLMFGSTDREGLFCISEDKDESREFDNKINLFSDDLAFKSIEEETAVAKKLKQYYFGNKDISRKTLMSLAEYYTDYFFEMPVLLEAELMTQHIDAPIYIYNFKYSGGRNMIKHITGFKDEPGACHGDDMMYMFKSKLWPFKISNEDQKIITWMTTMTTNFAKYGDPTPDQMNDFPVKWLPSDKKELKVLYINEDLKMGQIPKPDAFQFWKNLYSKYRKL